MRNFVGIRQGLTLMAGYATPSLFEFRENK